MIFAAVLNCAKYSNKRNSTNGAEMGNQDMTDGSGLHAGRN